MIKKTIDDLAIFGAKPFFSKALPVGQLNFPEWENFEKKFREIFSRKYYTNQGPLTEELEKKLCKFLNVKNVICVTNATLGLMVAAKALNLRGKVIMPSFTFIATAQSLSWAGLEPVFCEVNKENHLISAKEVSRLIDDNVSAILGVHLWGNCCHSDDLAELAKKHNLKLYYDSAHAFGCSHNGINVANFGEAEVFSFHATKILNSAEGGCISTNDDDLAEKMRNIRSSYGIRKVVDIPFTSNARMSEAQAAMALMSLEEYDDNQKRNESYFDLYFQELSCIPGLRFIKPKKNEKHNYQYLVIEVLEKNFGISRDGLVKILEAENVMCRKYFVPGSHLSYPYNEEFPQYRESLPITDEICHNIFQVPSGKLISKENIVDICRIIKFVHSNSVKISNKLS